ncbi:hypothetical protein [Bryobacter aggregatus]|uniref:hypothetical protein n=1 Tax=Bryobacter aggregatus TaxID=360054 RepID=UPI0004E1D7BF|nr:hypothetical protein [Bryobacter aggregatus]
MILSATINDKNSAELELDFTTRTWSIPPAAAKWNHVMFSDRGVFDVRPSGVIWLLDGLGSRKKDCTVILHAAPTGEQDLAHRAGTGRAYAPALPAYKDGEIRWRILRSSPLAVAAIANTSGSLTPVRAKAKEIAEQLLPKPGELSKGVPAPGARGTGCGEFPGRVMRRMPVLGPPQRGAFEIAVPGLGKLYLTSPMTQWEEFAKAVDQKYNPAKRIWVPFSGSNRPKTGDIYTLTNFENQAKFQHVGMIISAEGNSWVTADGGQGNGWQSGFVRRKFYATGQIDGEFGNKAWMKGWVDLDNLRETLAQWFPKGL